MYGAHAVASAALESAGMAALAAWSSLASLGSPLGHVRGPPTRGNKARGQRMPLPAQLGNPVLGTSADDDSDDDGIAEAAGAAGSGGSSSLAVLHARDGGGRHVPGTEGALVGLSHSAGGNGRLSIVIAAAAAVRQKRDGDAALLLLRRRPALLAFICRRAAALWVSAKLAPATKVAATDESDTVDVADPSSWLSGHGESARGMRAIAYHCSAAATGITGEGTGSFEIALAAACRSAAADLELSSTGVTKS